MENTDQISQSEMDGSIPPPATKPFRLFDLHWHEPLGLQECPYLVRWAVVAFGYAVRLHHWTASDDQRCYHDHPFWMLMLILKGGYLDIGDCVDVLTPGSIRFRRASHKHTVKVNPGGC